MDKNYDEISLFRFGIIAPILNNTHGFCKKSEYLSFAAQQNYTFKGKTTNLVKVVLSTGFFHIKSMEFKD